MKTIKKYLHLFSIIAVYSISGVFAKIASFYRFLSLPFVLAYIGMFLMLGIYAICWQQIIKRMPLSVAYASRSIDIVLGIVWGRLLFGESITHRQLFGAILVMFGVFMYNIGAEDNG